MEGCFKHPFIVRSEEMKNKGFTLVELLAVIIVLAVIATITYPAMTDLIAKAQIRGARTRAISWVDSVDKSMVNNEFTYYSFNDTARTANGNT